MLWNAGHLPEGWTMDRLLGKHPSRPANPLLANAFFRAGYIESWGRGIEKIARECREHGIEPPGYDFEMSGLMLTFRANPAHLAAALGTQTATTRVEQTGEAATGSVATAIEETPVKTPVKTPEQILAMLAANPDLTLEDLASSISKSASAVERAAAKLVKEGRLRFVGPRKGGHWEVLK